MDFIARRRPGARLERALALIGIGLLTAAAAACGAGESASETGDGDQDRTVVVAAQQVTSLDPGLAGTTQAYSLLGSVYSTLTRFTADGSLVGDLATEWRQDDATTWTFTLREGATFEDGEPLDAETVVWNLERAHTDDKLTGVARIASIIETAEAVSPTEVRFTTSGTYLNLPGAVSTWYFLAPEWSASHDPNTSVNASGPYKVVSFAAATGTVLERNPGYYGEAPAVEDLEYRVFADQATLISALLADEVDVATLVPPSDLEQIAETGDYEVGGDAGYRIHVLQVNALKPVWQNQDVREAVALAIDRESITGSVLGGFTEPSRKQVFGVGFVGYQDDLEPWPHDPDRARQLLEGAGAVGTAVELAVPIGYFNGGETAAETIVEQLDQVGFEATLNVVPVTGWGDVIASGADGPDLVYIGEASASNSSAEALLKYQSKDVYPSSNTKGPVSEEIDGAIADAWAAQTIEDQAAAVERATNAIIDTVRVIDLWPQPQTFVARKDLDVGTRPYDYLRGFEIAWAGS